MIQQETVLNVADNTGAKSTLHPGHGWFVQKIW